MNVAKPPLNSALWQPSGMEGTTTDVDQISGWIEQYSQHPLSILLSINGGELFVRARTGGVGFFRWGTGLLVVGGVMTDDEDHGPTLAAFLDWCEREKLTPRFVHFPPATASALADLGFMIDQLGASYSLSFQDSKLSGKGYQQVRRKLNKARRLGVTVERIRDEERYLALVPELEKINLEWLGQKGAKHIELLVCEFERVKPDANTLIYAAWHQNELIAYIVFSRTSGENPGWFHNLSRRRAECVDGTMQLIVHSLMQEIDSGVIHFGFTPLVDLTESTYPHSVVAKLIAKRLASLGGVVYPARSQRQYKVSWCPSEVIPEYLAYRGNTLGAMLWFLRATNSL